MGPMWRPAPKTTNVRRWRVLRSPVCLGCHVFEGRGVLLVGARSGDKILVVRPPIRYPDDEGDGSLPIDVLTQFPGRQAVISLVGILVSDSRHCQHPLGATRDANPALINFSEFPGSPNSDCKLYKNPKTYRSAPGPDLTWAW